MAKVSEAPPVGAVSTIDVSQFVQQAANLVGNHVWWMLYGPSGHGKTVAFASAAENCPRTFAPGTATTMTQLEGVGIVQFDRGGVDSLVSLGLDMPVLDLSSCTTVHSIREGIKLLPEFVKQYKLHTLGVDTWSALDKAVIADLQPKFGEKFGLYQEALAHHGETLKTMRSLPCNVIFICHSKVKTSFKDGEFKAAAENKARATETPGDFNVSMDLSGQTKDQIRAQCSAIFPVIAEKVGKREADYAIYTGGYPGFEYKSRYRCFGEKEKPNLYRMMEQVKGAK